MGVSIVTQLDNRHFSQAESSLAFYILRSRSTASAMNIGFRHMKPYAVGMLYELVPT